ncbi:MAG TPA: secretin N-terminal domain-containing protein [Spirochaetota bacterium]|nr:secretin N-terminal domain-containing protein [Spirochaetota bacterium]HOM09713.1 secretin N-terminal domain-containing protein [Spirochaetota bacterium]HPP49468.1 secretin N-terminal domain-containing protein [Spirochaetota bacterium]
MKKNKLNFNYYLFIILSSLFIISFLYAQQENTNPEKPAETQTPQAEIITPKDEQKESQAKPEIKIKKNKGKKKSKEQYFTLNFKDVELSEFLGVMSQLIGKNIVIDERVRGKITISSVKKIPVKDAYEVMKAILELKGFAVVESENLIKILPIKDAIKKNVEVIIDTTKKQIVPSDDQTITYLQEIKNADAEQIANVLRALKSPNTDIIVYRDLNIIIYSGTASEIHGLIKIASSLDKKIQELEVDKTIKGDIHVVHLENADAEKLAAVLSRIPFAEYAAISKGDQSHQVDVTKQAQQIAQAKAAITDKQKLSIIANKETNSLIITAKPEEFRMIKNIIDQLDIVREQVLIEALIIEVSADSGWGFGIDWMLGDQYSSHLYGGSSIQGTPPSYTLPSGMTGKKIAVPLSTGFQIGYLSDKSMLGFALLNATGAEKHYNILSTPQILTTDNQEAEINVGEEIPVPTNNRISDTGVQFYTYEYKSVGVKLKLTPHITSQNSITLDLYQEVNSVLGQTTVLESGSVIPPKLGKRDIKTKINIADGKTIVVGGLITNNKSVEETKVPILGDIPLLGWFFKRKVVEYKKTNLLVFITPHIVTKQSKIDALTEQKREEQRRLQLD